MTGVRSAEIRCRRAGTFVLYVKIDTRRENEMISAWWLIPAILGGAMFGVFLVALASAGSRSRGDDE